jgi:tetratricopeptide (TPR) repeat protein
MNWLKSLFARRPRPPGPAGAIAGTPKARAPAALRERIEQLLVHGAATEARAVAQEAADQFPDDPGIHVLCGNACLAAGDAEGALDAFYLASHYDPGDERALEGRLTALKRLARTAEIPTALEEFLAVRPDHAGALHSLARIVGDAGDHARAVKLLEQALAARPDHAGALNDLGLLLAREFGDFARGEALLRRALELAPEANHARINLGWVLCEQRAYGAGFGLLDEALTRDPGDQETRLIRALSRLKCGELAAGWDDYEARHASPTARRRPFSFPQWDGTPLPEGRLLVFAEQGLGDQIMFASCLPDALERAPNCVIECEPRLGSLFARSFPAARVVTGPLRETMPDWVADAGPIHRQIALGSLPRLFRREARAFPPHLGYLRADPARVQAWRERLAACGPAPKVGISWRGGTLTSRRSLRSLELARFAPLMAGVRAQWVSLQYSDCSEELAALARDHGIAVHHWQEAIDDYDETAALVSALDVVVSVCTAIVHLSGSLGQRALVMVPYAAEWRYGAAGETMPWYPSVRMLRQRAPGDWDAVFEALRRELLTGVPAAA